MREHVDYRDAKDGVSEEAALRLVEDLINDTALERLREILDDRRPYVLGVHAEEATGRNKIPSMYAVVLADKLGLEVASGIVQASVANHGGGPSIYHRLVAQPAFFGPVEAGAGYLIVDDNVTAGGTLANLRGYIESDGGQVVAMSTLARGGDGRDLYLSLANSNLKQLEYKHFDLDIYWREEFGHGIDSLTEGEARHLLKAPSTHEIGSRIAAARRDYDDQEGEETPSNGNLPA